MAIPLRYQIDRYDIKTGYRVFANYRKDPHTRYQDYDKSIALACLEGILSCDGKVLMLSDKTDGSQTEHIKVTALHYVIMPVPNVSTPNGLENNCVAINSEGVTLKICAFSQKKAYQFVQALNNMMVNSPAPPALYS